MSTTKIDCPKCDGRGEYTSDLGDYQVECEVCDGSGSIVDPNETGKGHNLQSTAREYDSIKSSLELCLRVAVEQKEVRIGDINYVNMISLIEKYDMLATKEQDFYNDRA